jgi:hypothetical protein
MRDAGLITGTLIKIIKAGMLRERTRETIESGLSLALLQGSKILLRHESSQETNNLF